MSPIQKLSSSLFKRTQTILVLVSVFAVFGTILELSGGIWDAISHLMRQPEFFWTIQHTTVYTGVGLIGCSAILGSVVLIKGKITGTLKRGIQIIIMGSALSISAGYADFVSHDLFGIDGLLSLSHQPLELGLILNALGGFLILTDMKGQKLKKLLPISVVALIFSISWFGFNLALLLGNTILCLPLYEIFSSGCVVL